MVKAALEQNLHVFCEKPFCLSATDSEQLARMAGDRGLANQVGYHNRFVGTFREVKKLIGAGALGTISHVLAEAYGPVVLRPKGSTWRTRRSDGGGCLYDYAAHPINLLNWYFGSPARIGGSALNRVFSAETDDEVISTLYFADGKTAQLLVNWSDESYRKMSTKLTIWGSKGRITVDRQECQVYFSEEATPPTGYRSGWNIKYTTELTEEVWFYVRGEEYSAQLDHFIECIAQGRHQTDNSFDDAAATDRVIEMIIADASRRFGVGSSDLVMKKPSAKGFRFFGSR
jgi:predicted dehydrogenase